MDPRAMQLNLPQATAIHNTYSVSPSLTSPLLRETSVLFNCGNCRQSLPTRTESKVGIVNHAIAAGLVCSGCCIGGVCIFIFLLSPAVTGILPFFLAPAVGIIPCCLAP